MTWRLERDISGFMVRRSDEVTAQYRAAGYWRDGTLVDIARERAKEDPDRVLLIEGERRLTRGEAWDKAWRLAFFLMSRGLKPGDVISYQMPNWVESSVVALAARMVGLVINPVPPIYRDSELEYILKDCGSKLIFIPETFRKFDYVAMMRRLGESLPKLKDVVVVRGGTGHALTLEEAVRFEPPAGAALPTVAPDALMMVMYTSGTTSKPKGVLHSHYTYDYRARAMGEVWNIGPEDVIFMPSPVTHITGALWCVDMPWVRGSASVLMDVWTPEEGIRVIREQRCTVTGGATPFLQQLYELASPRPADIKTLRMFFCGGTTVAPDLIKKAAAAFPHCLFFRAYGATEVPTTTVGIRHPSQAELGAETDGEILFPTEVRIVDPAGDAPVPDGEEGEILARGPEQFLGYLHSEDNDFDADGYFRMGDLGRRVHGDFLVITGRKKDIIIRSGENISPKEVEDLLSTHPDVLEAAIVAMPSATTGEKGCAFVIPRGDAKPDLKALVNFLDGAKLAKQKFPEHLVLVDDLPRVPSGKVRKDVLRTRAREIAAEEKELSSGR
jgi:acyl-CoA synthetase (AMP-forming)/AMP-acid ligase II